MSDVGTVYTLDVASALAGLDKIAEQDRQLRAGFQQTATVQKQTFTEAAQAALAYQQRLAGATMEVRTAAGVYADLRAELAKTVQSQRELERSQKSVTAGAGAAKLSRDLEDNRRKQAELRVEIDLTRRAIDQEREAVLRVKTAQQAQVAQQKLATAAAKDAAAAQKDAGSEGGFFGSLLGRVGPLAAGLFTVNTVVSKIREGINDFKALSGIESTFTAIAGSAREGGREMAFITNQANKLGLELVPTARAYTGLFAAAKEANIPIAVTRDLFTGLTDAGRVLGRSQAEVQGALKAVQDMASKGTIASQELKLQLGNALPGAFGLAAKAAGLTTAEFTKQIATGKVLASDFLPKLAKQLKLTYGDATADASAQAAANLGRINTFITNQSARLGALFGPAIKGIADFVAATETAAQKSDRVVSAYTKQRETFAELQQTVTPLVNRYEELSRVGTRNADEQRELDTVMQQLAKSVPLAVTEFDAYGKALGINSEAVRQFIKDQENLTRYNNRSALKENSAALRELLAEQEAYQRRVALLNETEQQTGKRVLPKGATPGGEILYFTPEESAKLVQEASDQLGRIQDDIRANLDNRQLLRGKSPLLPTGDDAANDQAIQGLIDKQQKLIDELRRRQISATQENQGDGGDFLFGAGGLNAQIETAQKEMDRLMGKVEKGAKARQRALEVALRALAAEELQLRKELGKAEIDALQDQGQARAAEQLRQDQEAIARLEQSLKEKEAAVRKAGGRGGKADGVIDGVQQEELGKLQLLAIDRYYAKLREIAQQQSDKMFALQADSAAKEIEAVERRYELEIFAAGANKEMILALEEAKGRELLALRQRQRQQAIDNEADLARNLVTANVGEFFGKGTGVSEVEARRNEKLALLEIDRKHAQDTLNNSLQLSDEEGRIVRAGTAARLAEIKNAIRAVEREKAAHPAEDFLYKLILGEEDDEEGENRRKVEEAVGIVINSLNTILQAEIAASQAKIDAKTREIDELNTRLSQEIAYNKQGSASNIANLKAEINAAKAARREALEDQRKAAKQQQLIQDLTAVSSIANAAANLILGWSTIPFVGQILGAVSVAAMLASFVATKTKAKQSIQAGSEGYFRGGYTGGQSKYEERGVVHGKEFVSTAETTEKYRPLLEALHTKKAVDWNTPALQALLPDYSLPGKLREERRAVVEHRTQIAFGPLQAELNGVKQQLAEMKQHTARIPEKQYVTQPDGSLLEIDTTTGNRLTYRMG